jgi:hypothetical protein
MSFAPKNKAPPSASLVLTFDRYPTSSVAMRRDGVVLGFR